MRIYNVYVSVEELRSVIGKARETKAAEIELIARYSDWAVWRFYSENMGCDVFHRIDSEGVSQETDEHGKVKK